MRDGACVGRVDSGKVGAVHTLYTSGNLKLPYGSSCGPSNVEVRFVATLDDINLTRR